MNNRDSEFITGLFMEKGFKKTDSIDAADIILYNTCSVRKHAEDRAISNMGTLLKRKDRKKIYGIIGCMAQAMKEDIFKMLPELDLVCGTGRIYQLPYLVEHAARSRVLACDNIDRDAPEMKSPYREDKKKAFVSIMKGCDNYCSYCIVPYVRGRERSRKFENIINEIKNLVDSGAKKIMLLGQNVNSYSSRGRNFVDLLKEINKIEGLEEIKFMTSHPKDATVGLFKAIKKLDKVAKELHLPIQSGSDRILKLMNRGYTKAKYLKLIKTLRRLIPGCRITTDIIVGFPTESEKDFKETYDLIKKTKFDAAYLFKYSPRPPAKAAGMKDDCPEEVKVRRHKTLLDLQRKISRDKRS